MNIKKIDNAINKVVGGKYRIEKHFSKTSNSYYVNIINGEMRVQLRFSDHLNKKDKKTKSFIVESTMSKKSLEGFIKNRIKMLQKISLYHAFDQIEGKTSMKPAMI